MLCKGRAPNGIFMNKETISAHFAPKFDHVRFHFDFITLHVSYLRGEKICIYIRFNVFNQI